MKQIALSSVTWALGAVLCLSGTAAAAAPDKVIDTFETGGLHEQMPAIWRTLYRSSIEAIGGVRQVTIVGTDTLGLSSTIDIGGHRLAVSSGLGSYTGVYLGYGYDSDGQNGGMHEDFSAYDHFRIDFESSDLELGYAVQVWDVNGNAATLDGTVSTAGALQGFSADFPLQDFRGHDAQGRPQAIDWGDITYVIVLFQSGSAIGANDFAVQSIRAVAVD